MCISTNNCLAKKLSYHWKRSCTVNRNWINKLINILFLQKQITKKRSNEFVNLNFKVDPETRRKLKQYAAKHDLSLKDVFEAAIAYYIEHHP